MSRAERMTRRWEEGVPHDPRSKEIYDFMEKLDWECGDCLGLKSGGDGDNGEHIMFMLDIFFEEKDRRDAKG